MNENETPKRKRKFDFYLGKFVEVDETEEKPKERNLLWEYKLKFGKTFPIFGRQYNDEVKAIILKCIEENTPYPTPPEYFDPTILI